MEFIQVFTVVYSVAGVNFGFSSIQKKEASRNAVMAVINQTRYKSLEKFLANQL